MSYFRAFRNAFVRELRSFGSHKFFYMLSLGLPILSFLFFILLFRTGVPGTCRSPYWIRITLRCRAG